MPNFKNDSDNAKKYGAINLLIAYAVAIKHHLRDEKGIYYEDLYPLLAHIPEYAKEDSSKRLDTMDNLPLELSYHISQHISYLKKFDLIDPVQMGQMIIATNGMVDVLSNLERIRSSPIPLAYAIHLRQTVMLYLLFLPFQLVDPVKAMGWATIIVVSIASFTLLGIEAVGGEIENPFGYDANDLRLDVFCQGATILTNIKKSILIFLLCKNHPVNLTVHFGLAL